ncbi:hypothetical protein D5S18_25425 [Nocardia panacis]|uniref:Intracellular septation protein A n=1 Tax=Nocardia panacis TaxID=2340916 RepID=A0A3A4K1D0_9NOCA|nr:VC0807 family protein [Nocardia panacis]RJO71252.1 hypothetical protein D5S18_25425 [Nocardia panacis]
MTTVPTGNEPKAASSVAKPVLASVLMPLVRDIGLPLGAYFGTKALGGSDFTGLLAGSLIAATILGYSAIRARRLDGMSLLLLVVFAFGLVSSLITGDARMMILKDSVGTVSVGLALLVSALVGRPLTYYGARRAMAARGPAALADFEHRYQNKPALRRTIKQSGILWGTGLTAEAVARAVLAFQLPVSTMVWLSSVLMVGTIALLMPVSIALGLRNKRADAAGGAEAAAVSSAA